MTAESKLTMDQLEAMARAPWCYPSAAMTKALLQLVADLKAANAQIEELDFLRHEGGPDSVAALEAEVTRLRKARLRKAQTAAALDVLAERQRQRQVTGEGWTPEHDDANNDGEMAQAAACYALNAAGWKTEALRGCWPIKWMAAWFKPTDPRRDLVKAGALILAEIERLDRATHAARREGEA